MQTPQGFHTPLFIKRLIQLIVGFTLLGALLEPFTMRFWGVSLQSILSLTPLATSRYFVWQFVTSIFFIPTATLSFGFFLDLAFSMLILWLFGTLLYERIGSKRFIIGTLIAAITSGVSALLAMLALQEAHLYSECLPAILAVVTMWTMADPSQQLYLLFLLPLKAQWVLAIALVATILGNALDYNYVAAAGYLGAFLASYFYGLFVLDFRSPFAFMLGFDRVAKKSWYRIRSFWQWHILSLFRKK